MSFTTSWLNLAGLQGYQRAYFFYLLGVYLSPHKLQVSISYDYNSAPLQQDIITPDNGTPYYGGDNSYGAGSQPYGGIGNVEQWRVFFQQGKCQAFQIAITEIYDPSIMQLAYSSIVQPSGAGFTLSGLDLVVGQKSGYPRIPSSRYVG
jgi:hypothetical protein